MDPSDTKKIMLPSIEARDLASAISQTGAGLPQSFNFQNPRTILLCCIGEVGGDRTEALAALMNCGQSPGVIPGGDALFLATIAVQELGTHAESGPIRQLLCKLAKELSEPTMSEWEDETAAAAPERTQ
jgi:hypothetical protein